MNYLADTEYQTYGLESGYASNPGFPPPALSSTLIAIGPRSGSRSSLNAFASFPAATFSGSPTFPLAIPSGGTTPLVSGRARYGVPRRGDDLTMWEMASEFAMTFGLPGTWIDLDVTNFDFFAPTGEVSWLPNPLGMYFDEMELAYNAGFNTIPDPIKFACAQLVRNAQAMPALNVREGTLNAMHFAYFADTLLDSTVQTLLAPFVAQKAA